MTRLSCLATPLVSSHVIKYHTGPVKSRDSGIMFVPESRACAKSIPRHMVTSFSLSFQSHPYMPHYPNVPFYHMPPHCVLTFTYPCSTLQASKLLSTPTRLRLRLKLPTPVDSNSDSSMQSPPAEKCVSGCHCRRKLQCCIMMKSTMIFEV